jgi:hypothetical protein
MGTAGADTESANWGGLGRVRVAPTINVDLSLYVFRGSRR